MECCLPELSIMCGFREVLTAASWMISSDTYASCVIGPMMGHPVSVSSLLYHLRVICVANQTGQVCLYLCAERRRNVKAGHILKTPPRP